MAKRWTGAQKLEISLSKRNVKLLSEALACSPPSGLSRLSTVCLLMLCFHYAVAFPMSCVPLCMTGGPASQSVACGIQEGWQRLGMRDRLLMASHTGQEYPGDALRATCSCSSQATVLTKA